MMMMMMMNNDDKYSIFTQTATAAKIRNNKILEKVGEYWWKYLMLPSLPELLRARRIRRS